MISAWKNNKILKKWIKKNSYNFFNCNFNYDLSDLYSDPLLKGISEYLNVDKENIYVGAGSSQIINAILNLKCWDHIILSFPEFKLYYKTAVLSKQKIKLIESITCDEFVKKISKEKYSKKDLLCISSPRWFSGERFNENQINEIIDVFPGTIMIDEAYIDFSINPNGLIDLCLKNNRIMLLRTFSKKYYLSGLRIGYLLTKKRMDDLRNIAIPPHSISSFSSNFVISLLNDKKILQLFDNTLEVIINNREYLIEKLNKYDKFRIIKSESNFVTLLFENKSDFHKVANIIKKFPGVQIFDDNELLYIKIWISNFHLIKKICKLIEEAYD